jgi:lipopolysaccharide export LptBFGC system permease protein LptF
MREYSQVCQTFIWYPTFFTLKKESILTAHTFTHAISGGIPTRLGQQWKLKGRRKTLYEKKWQLKCLNQETQKEVCNFRWLIFNRNF